MDKANPILIRIFNVFYNYRNKVVGKKYKLSLNQIHDDILDYSREEVEEALEWLVKQKVFNKTPSEKYIHIIYS